MLEECGLPYTTKPINILKGEQFDPDFLAISPNNRIPAIVDHDGPNDEPLALFESGAILQYLAEKTGQFLPQGIQAKYTCSLGSRSRLPMLDRCLGSAVIFWVMPLSPFPMQ